ncbi:hypothetical protein FGO68_gene9562 [Halteria grandinella]|uniref:Uncharacterized protein n=1 Tax=Halteria grandinella TaxID=5974 RepID=A0A8J8SV75_HALGN|nr:hypothetical protein FGO68_gene9562 [Halteria grandinella]
MRLNLSSYFLSSWASDPICVNVSCLQQSIYLFTLEVETKHLHIFLVSPLDKSNKKPHYILSVMELSQKKFL